MQKMFDTVTEFLAKSYHTGTIHHAHQNHYKLYLQHKLSNVLIAECMKNTQVKYKQKSKR